MSYGIIIWIVLLIAAAGLFIYSRNVYKKISTQGVETEGTVSRIDENYDEDTGNTTYYYYVKYLDENNNEHEALIHNPKNLKAGDRIRIKYLPGNGRYAQFIDYL